MRCTTCGEVLRDGEDRCPTCGSVVASRPVPAFLHGVRQCTRCGYRGDGIPYFRKAAHVGLLAGLSLFTYGVGGVIYYAARRSHEVCPSCGLGWEHAREPGPPREPAAPVPVSGTAVAGGSTPLLPSGGGRRVAGGVLAGLATLMISLGLVGGEFEPVVMGSVFGMAGSGLFLGGWRAMQRRRQAVLLSLHRKVLLMATERRGVLTVTEVAAELALSLPAAEKLMTGMDDGFRVRSEVTEDGIIVYEFPEVLHQKKLRKGGSD